MIHQYIYSEGLQNCYSKIFATICGWMSNDQAECTVSHGKPVAL